MFGSGAGAVGIDLGRRGVARHGEPAHRPSCFIAYGDAVDTIRSMIWPFASAGAVRDLLTAR